MLQLNHTAIVKAKISIPYSKSPTLERLRLLQAVEDAGDGRLTLVCAPAGFGKTTLLAQWARTTGRRVAWLALDALDNDPARFWKYVVHTLAAGYGADAEGRLLPLADSLSALSLPAFLDALNNGLEALGEPAALILDDLHLIGEPRIHEGLVYLLQYLPAHVRLIVASRTPPAFQTAKWLARGEQSGIGAAQLQFTREEAELFLRAELRLELSDQQLARLLDTTEGWPTGLRLAAMPLRSGEHADRVADGFRGGQPGIARYLSEEVVAGLPAEIRTFLLRTSPLERLDAELCAAVTGCEDSSRLLRELLSLNLFLVPLDDDGLGFRYNRLFAETLRSLYRSSDLAGWQSANRLAAEWLAGRDRLEEAILHAGEAKAFPLMERCIHRHAPYVLEQGEFQILLQWLEQLPEAGRSPETELLLAFVLVVTGQPRRADERLASVARSYASLASESRRAQLQSGMLFVRSNLVFSTGQFEAWFRFAADIMEDMLPSDPVYYNFNYNRTEPLVRMTPFGLKGVLSPDTERIGLLFAGTLEAHGWQRSLISLYVIQSLCEGYYEWNRLEECRKLLQTLRQAPETGRIPGLFVPLAIVESRLLLAAGQAESAKEALAQAAAVTASMSSPSDTRWPELLRAQAIRVELADGPASAVRARRAADALDVPPQARATLDRSFVYLTLIRCLGGQRKETAALRLLEQLKAQFAREAQLAGLAEALMLEALLLDKLGRRASAIQALHESLRIGEGNGYVRTYADEGRPLAKLLRAYIADRRKDGAQTRRIGVGTVYAEQVLAAFPGSDADEPASAAQLIEPLSRSELELLRLLRCGDSNKAIAAALSLSEGTVKVYLSRLYGKLGVSSRTQAIGAADRLRLLEP